MSDTEPKLVPRRFRNHGSVPVLFPTLGVSVAPGEEVEVQFPAEQPCPECLTETTGKPEKKPAAKTAAEESK